MAECKWCEKSLPGKDIPACGSCVLEPMSAAKGPVEKSNGPEESSFDLDYLKNDKKDKAPRSGESVQQDVFKASFHTKEGTFERAGMKRYKIKSNSLRDRNELIGSVVLKFDGNGIATVTEAEIGAVKRVMSLRPGRFSILENEPSDSPVERVEEARKAVEEYKSQKKAEDLPEVSEKDDRWPEPVIDDLDDRMPPPAKENLSWAELAEKSSDSDDFEDDPVRLDLSSEKPPVKTSLDVQKKEKSEAKSKTASKGKKRGPKKGSKNKTSNK